jgi:hypothetical protein
VKSFFKFFVLILFVTIGLSGCRTSMFQLYETSSWAIPETEFIFGTEDIRKPSLYLLPVFVDRTGAWTSVEKEIADLAPLLLWEQGLRLSGIDTADYLAEISAREREYVSGWKTKRSLAVEVRIWKNNHDIEEAFRYNGLPLAAGRVTARGEEGFSSSETTGRMLKLALKKAVSALKNRENR